MFRDLTDRIARNPPARHYGVAAADLAGDGPIQLVVAGFGGPNRVLRWVGDRLIDVAPPELADPDRPSVSVAAADLDGDGRDELYILNTDTFTGPKRSADRLFARRPDGSWEDLFDRPANRTVRNLSAGRSVAAVDRRGTGRYGFFVASHGKPLRLYEAGTGGTLADLAPSLGLDRVAGGRGLWVGPLTSDRSDLFVGAEDGPNLLFRNDGDGQFAEVAAELHLADPAEHARGVAGLDADGDGRLDLCWGNWDGPHRLMVRQVDGTFRDRATPALALPSSVRTVIAADFDNDGHEELFFNNLGEPNRLFGVRGGEWRLLDPGPAALPDGLGTGAAVADIDGDGVLELLVAHGEGTPQPLSLFKAASAGRSVRVRPLTRFGAAARGAVVRLTAGGREQVRVVDGGSGYLCQMEPVAHFGLGRLDRAERVSVTWPDGCRQALPAVPAGADVRVPHPGG
jgi:hypothetical protein